MLGLKSYIPCYSNNVRLFVLSWIVDVKEASFFHGVMLLRWQCYFQQLEHDAVVIFSESCYNRHTLRRSGFYS